MKNILIIDGHPDAESLCASLSESYNKGAMRAGFETKLVKLRDLDFKLSLENGYRKRTDLEPDLLETIEYIKDTDHFVLVYPIWWGTFPALLKGFIDRTFLPGITYNPSKGIKWEKLLKGKTARLISTMDAPLWYNKFYYKHPANNAMKKATLQYCGVGKVKTTEFSPIKSSTVEKREKWITKVEKMGLSGI
ncbi:MAG: NAD(P)H-dependent oxidoreductase [Prolixibacteraceae bacterium]|jgi:NAD(P)H dehydrogenase (quinone)|nr:NAD(P)H-dependent oxidoreductase [Prolixibacteraceae bacterium]